jgi:ATP-binding cassette, subfamily B, bacterial
MFHTKRLPVVLQMSAADCGAACLAMILGYWGERVSVGTCQGVMGGGQNGVTALMIADAARQMGLTVQAFRHTPQGLAGAPLPAIVHWGGVHFVVLEKYTPNQVTIVDPALGRRTLTPEAFADGYSGVTLTFDPSSTFAESVAALVGDAPPATWRLYARRALSVPGSRGLLAQLLIASLLLQLAGLILPAATWLVVERILPVASPPGMGLLGMGLAVALLAQAGVIYVRDLLVVRLQARLDSHLIPDFLAHLLSLPYDFFQQRTSGDLISRLEGNAAVRQMISSGVLGGLLDGGLALLYLIILYAQSPIFGLVVTGMALGQFLLLARTGERVHEFSQMALATRAEEEGFAVQILRGIESVKAAGTEEWIFDQWRTRFDTTLAADVARDRYVARINSLLQLLTQAAPLLLLWIGVGAVTSGQLSLGQMLALVVLASSSLAPLGSLAGYVNQAQQIWAYLERLGDVLTAQPEEEAGDGAAPVELCGRIQVEDLCFQYGQHHSGREGGFGLAGISFEIGPGEQVAIVGPTGAGKSTLVRLLLGLYQPQAGVIRYDGRPLSELSLTQLRREIGVVLQDAFLISGSIRENIALHQPQMPLEQVVEAAKLAAIHEEILRLPMGYETRVGEGGSGLSGGQRQRLVLARALATRPRILILDEASSHLDSITEAQIQGALDELQATRLIIAHRLSSVAHADWVLVLEEGRLVEAGSPAALATQGGAYSRLLQAQGSD